MDKLNGMTVEEGADFVMHQVSEIDIEYAVDPLRGSYKGFAALHDLCDANMLLPFVGELDLQDDKVLSWYGKIMSLVTVKIIEKSK